MITPTVGRVVHYYPSQQSEPRAAMIAYVHSDTTVNLSVLGHNGSHTPKVCVDLVQPGEAKPRGRPFCCWMPYQVKKATGSESGEKAAGEEVI